MHTLQRIITFVLFADAKKTQRQSMNKIPPLYPYQQKLEDSVLKEWKSGKKRLFVQLGTGGGKTFIFSDIANKTLKKGNKVLIVTHRDELLTQAGGTLERFGLNPALITSQTKHVPSGNGLYVSMIETLVNRLKKEEWQEWYKDINLLICDEGHLQDFNKLLENPLTREKYVLGFSATPKRTGHQRQLSEDYEELICGPDVQTLINMGYLVPDRYFGVPIDLKGVHLDKGEYNTEELFDKYNKKELYAGVIDNWKRICPDTITIVFCVNVQHTINTCKAFNDAGIKAKFLVSEVAKPKNDTKLGEYQNYLDNFEAFSGKRKDVISEFKRGDFKVLVNCGIATTGFDYPEIQTVIMNRATTSENLLMQCLGRGARIHPNKEYFNLLDFGENCKRLGYYRQEREYSLTHEESSKKGEGVAGVKTCPKCKALLNTSTMMCKYCGYVFEKTQEQKIVELVEIKYSEAKQELKTIKDYEIYCKAKSYNKNWLFRQIFVKFGKDGLIEYQRTHNLNPSWVYIMLARYKAMGIK